MGCERLCSPARGVGAVVPERRAMARSSYLVPAPFLRGCLPTKGITAFCVVDRVCADDALRRTAGWAKTDGRRVYAHVCACGLGKAAHLLQRLEVVALARPDWAEFLSDLPRSPTSQLLTVSVDRRPPLRSTRWSQNCWLNRLRFKVKNIVCIILKR